MENVQRFRVGDKVIRRQDGVMGQVAHIGESDYPVYVAWDNPRREHDHGTYTADGAMFAEGPLAIYLVEPASWAREFTKTATILGGFCLGVLYAWVVDCPFWRCLL